MREQVAEFEHGIVEIVAEHRLAEMLDEDPADRAAVVEDAAIVAGAGPYLVALLGIVDELAEERRLQRLGILLEAADQDLGDEFRRLLGEEDIAVDEVQDLDRNVLEALAPHEDDDRHLEAALAHQVDERRRLAVDALLAPIDQDAADRGVGLDGDLGILDARRAHHLKPSFSTAVVICCTRTPSRSSALNKRGADQKGKPSEEVHGSDSRSEDTIGG